MLHCTMLTCECSSVPIYETKSSVYTVRHSESGTDTPFSNRRSSFDPIHFNAMTHVQKRALGGLARVSTPYAATDPVTSLL